MKRIIAALFALFALVAFASPAHAAPQVLAYAYYSNTQIDQPVEQQTDLPWPDDRSEWVINPLGGPGKPCAWDVDDHWQQMAFGPLAAGGTLSVDECMVADASSHYKTVYGMTSWWSNQHGQMAVQVTAKIPDLDISVCYAPLGRCLHPGPRWDSAQRKYEYASCSKEIYNPGDPALIEIPGSQGGVGRVSTITVAISNPTSRAAKDIASVVEVMPVHAFDRACDTTVMPPAQQAYPLTWSQT